MKNSFIILCISIIGLAALTLMLNLTSPTEIGPFGVLLFFTTFYIVAFCIIFLIYKSFLRLAFKRTIVRRKDYFYAAVFAFAPIILLMARSFNTISIWTICLTVLFVGLAEFLVAKKF